MERERERESGEGKTEKRERDKEVRKVFSRRETGQIVNSAGSNSTEDTFYERAFPRGKTDAVYSSRYDTLHSRISMNRNGSQLPIVGFCAGRGAEIASPRKVSCDGRAVCDLTDLQAPRFCAVIPLIRDKQRQAAEQCFLRGFSIPPMRPAPT